MGPRLLEDGSRPARRRRRRPHPRLHPCLLRGAMPSVSPRQRAPLFRETIFRTYVHHHRLREHYRSRYQRGASGGLEPPWNWSRGERVMRVVDQGGGEQPGSGLPAAVGQLGDDHMECCLYKSLRRPPASRLRVFRGRARQEPHERKLLRFRDRGAATRASRAEHCLDVVTCGRRVYGTGSCDAADLIIAATSISDARRFPVSLITSRT